MKTTLKILIYAGLLFSGAEAWSQPDDTVNEALSQSDCDQAQLVYNAWKAYTSKTSSEIERHTSECKNWKTLATIGNTSSSGGFYTKRVNGAAIDMVHVQDGTFTMGCTSEQDDDFDEDEYPAHQVTFNGYYSRKAKRAHLRSGWSGYLGITYDTHIIFIL